MRTAFLICSGVSDKNPSVLSVVKRIELPRAATVRRPHERGADQNAAVDNELERPRFEPLVALAEGDRQFIDEALDGRGIARVGDTDCDGRPHEQTVGGAECLVSLIALERGAAFDDARDPGREVLSMDLLERIQGRRAGLVTEPGQQAARVPQHASRLARGVLHDRAAGRLGRVARDAGCRERRGIKRERIRAVDDDRMSGGGCIQFAACREAMLAQAGRIRTRRPDPGVPRPTSRLAANPVLQFRNRREVLKRLHGLPCSDIERVDVRVDDAGHHRPAAPLDHACP